MRYLNKFQILVIKIIVYAHNKIYFQDSPVQPQMEVKILPDLEIPKVADSLLSKDTSRLFFLNFCRILSLKYGIQNKLYAKTVTFSIFIKSYCNVMIS